MTVHRLWFCGVQTVHCCSFEQASCKYILIYSHEKVQIHIAFFVQLFRLLMSLMMRDLLLKKIKKNKKKVL